MLWENWINEIWWNLIFLTFKPNPNVTNRMKSRISVHSHQQHSSLLRSEHSLCKKYFDRHAHKPQLIERMAHPTALKIVTFKRKPLELILGNTWDILNIAIDDHDMHYDIFKEWLIWGGHRPFPLRKIILEIVWKWKVSEEASNALELPKCFTKTSILIFQNVKITRSWVMIFITYNNVYARYAIDVVALISKLLAKDPLVCDFLQPKNIFVSLF